jgi:hypothetical protein
MERRKARNRFTCEAVMWTNQGPCLSFEEQHAFRYEVREHGHVVGYITTDRARTHPDVMWERSLLRDGKIEQLTAKFKTIEEAFAAF